MNIIPIESYWCVDSFSQWDW